MTHMNYLVYKNKYTQVKKIVIKKLSIKRKNIFSSYSLNFPVSLIVYVAFCLRKRGPMAFCEKSYKGTDTLSYPACVCIKKRVMYRGRGIQKGSGRNYDLRFKI